MLTDTNLAAPATRWTLDFLSENIGDDNFTVYESNSHKFKYSDEKRANLKGFVPQMRRKEMKFKEFAEKLKNWKPGDKRCGGLPKERISGLQFSKYHSFH